MWGLPQCWSDALQCPMSVREYQCCAPPVSHPLMELFAPRAHFATPRLPPSRNGAQGAGSVAAAESGLRLGSPAR